MTTRKHEELTPDRIATALAGDRAALTELYRCYGPRVRAAVAQRIVHRGELVPVFEDLLAEVWARLLADGCQRLRSYDRTRGPFGYFVQMRALSVADDVIAKHLRRTRSIEPGDPYVELQSGEDLERRVVHRERLERLATLVRSRFGDEDQRLFEAVLVGGRKPGDVAEDLGVKRESVERRLRRLIERLKQLIAAEPDPPSPLDEAR